MKVIFTLIVLHRLLLQVSGKPFNLSQTFECGREVTNKRLLLGRVVESPTLYPWMAFLASWRYPPNQRIRVSYCNGALISNRHILTAAHCIPEYTREIFIRLGTIHRDGNEGAIITRRWIIHENYDDNLNYLYDIALIELPEPVSFNDNLRPICLPPPNFVTTNKLMKVAAWGQYNFLFDAMSDVLREIDVRDYDLHACKERAPNLNENHVCARGDDYETLCEGDSGSPLMFRTDNHWIVVGIASATPHILDDRIGLCDPFDPAIFTRVSKYLNWIYNKIN